MVSLGVTVKAKLWIKSLAYSPGAWEETFFRASSIGIPPVPVLISAAVAVAVGVTDGFVGTTAVSPFFLVVVLDGVFLVDIAFLAGRDVGLAADCGFLEIALGFFSKSIGSLGGICITDLEA